MDARKCTDNFNARELIEKLKKAEEQADREGWISAENIKAELDILTVSDRISRKALKEMDIVVDNLKRGEVSPVVDMSDVE